MKKLIAIALSALLLLSLVACGNGGETNTPTGNQSTTRDEGGNQAATGQIISDAVHDINLIDYTDRTLGYQMRCPELTGKEQAYSDYWIYRDKDDERALLFAFSEYHEDATLFSEDTAGVKDSHAIPALFLPVYKEICAQKLGVILGNAIENLSWTDMDVSGLPAAEFRGTIKSDAMDAHGITGICVVGANRPYVFWAIDISKDQSYLELAGEVLEACVANFKEGS